MNRRVLFAIIGGGVVIIAVVIITSLLSVQNTGLLKITTDINAELTLSQTAHEDKELGKGSLVLRLEPGSYQITAKKDNELTVATAKVTSGEQTNLNVDLRTIQNPFTVTEYSAEDIYADETAIRFLNTAFSQLFTFNREQTDALRYLEHVYPVTDVYWLDSSHVFTKNEYGVWSYADNNASRFLDTASTAFISNSFSFNGNGQVSFVDESGNVYLLDNPNATARKIGTAAINSPKTALSSNGDVLVYGRTNNKGGVIFTRTGEQKELPASIENPQFATWSPDDSKVALALNTGFIFYNIKTQSIQQLTQKQPTHPNSLTWLNNQEVAYSQEQAMWRATAQTAYKLADISGLTSDKQLFVRAGTLYYATTPDSNNNGGNIYTLELN